MKKKSAVITNKINDIVNSDVQLNDYLLGDTLGIGGFSVVRKVSRLNKRTNTTEYFALKIIRRSLKVSNNTKKNGGTDIVKKEIALLKKLNHPNVIKLFEVIDDPAHNSLFLVLEYVSDGQLMDRISEVEYQSNHVLISMENETNLLAFENILNADIDKLLEQQEQETIDTYLLEDNND